MTRNLFGAELFWTAAGLDVQLAPNTPFTLWSERVGGIQLTDCTAPDGVTALATNTAGAFLADGSGQMPALRGPDEVFLMWVDSGTGVRYGILAVEAVRDRLATVGGLNVEAVQDTVAAMFGSQVTYDDVNGTIAIVGGVGGGGITDHGGLSGLGDDDHPQYLTAARGDARYATSQAVSDAIASAVAASSGVDRDRTKHFGVQPASSISDFSTVARGVMPVFDTMPSLATLAALGTRFPFLVKTP